MAIWLSQFNLLRIFINSHKSFEKLLAKRNYYSSFHFSLNFWHLIQYLYLKHFIVYKLYFKLNLAPCVITKMIYNFIVQNEIILRIK